MRNKIREMLPHAAVVICNMYVVFFLIDRVNGAMNFIDNGLTKGLLLALCAIGLYDAWVLVTGASRQPARPPEPDYERRQPDYGYEARPQRSRDYERRDYDRERPRRGGYDDSYRRSADYGYERRTRVSDYGYERQSARTRRTTPDYSRDGYSRSRDCYGRSGAARREGLYHDDSLE